MNLARRIGRYGQIDITIQFCIFRKVHGRIHFYLYSFNGFLCYMGLCRNSCYFNRHKGNQLILKDGTTGFRGMKKKLYQYRQNANKINRAFLFIYFELKKYDVLKYYICFVNKYIVLNNIVTFPTQHSYLQGKIVIEPKTDLQISKYMYVVGLIHTYRPFSKNVCVCLRTKSCTRYIA